MKFFKPEDFIGVVRDCETVAKQANAKLEREGRVVYNTYGSDSLCYHQELSNFATSKALIINEEPLLINIEPIEKELDLDKHKDEIQDKADKLREVFGNTPEFGNVYEIMVKQVCTKKPCKHPVHKIVVQRVAGPPDYTAVHHGYQCECGVRVIPIAFEAAEERITNDPNRKTEGT